MEKLIKKFKKPPTFLEVEVLRATILSKDDKSLIKLIRKEFEQRGHIKQSRYQINLLVLEELDLATINTGIIRMKRAEKVYDTIKQLSFIFTLVIAAYSYFNKYLDETGGTAVAAVLVGGSLFSIFIFICVILRKSRDTMLTCIYFKSLLEDVKEHKKIILKKE